ncbi:hypothetical protein ACIN5162_3401 [Acinetobacter baumannii OIFC0162]|uniref:Uncharacterized protein n=1 Tax=Acinetobacter baumannii 6014059 TaxID=525242 RepID=A0A828SWB2_ACIBA|nr:hypothetical protein AN415_00003 [Acinetobacter baumannii]EGJ69396.1 hypothetical protein HMPREF0022_00878 [Acinetobacter baumannii 6014059]EKK05374.1 hypothetical protein ACIN5162_3401 [Acinetobacter baumannii OIFC0162]ETR83828.1 hypothetical protein M212_3594 [Acinetobacter baumannii CI79]EXG88803.1 hypothetical protein J624_3783 [Acinetobacter baumannii 1062314]EXH35814.1 hypothetical protein J629_3495 [Acinetobacter baumannii 1207552]EXH78548.1 hypothetical protein J637_3389 [Acinetoba
MNTFGQIHNNMPYLFLLAFIMNFYDQFNNSISGQEMCYEVESI